MTTETGNTPATVPMTIQQPSGWRDVLRAIDSIRSGEIESPEDLVESLTMHGFNYIIRQRLDAIYPADHFRTKQYGVNWHSEHGGEDIEKGVKYVTLLYMALEELGAWYQAEAGPAR